VIVVDPEVSSGGDKQELPNGTGFIISEDGWIATNAHVVEDAAKVKVILHDGSEYPVQVVRIDRQSDIALLKVDCPPSMPYVRFADSDAAEVGEGVIAIGNPFGFGMTVTSGIVSYKGRNLSGQLNELGAGGGMVSYIQTDAAINYGNSGGPLFNSRGEVVGMITVFFSDGMHNTGINFAIPSNTLKAVVQELRDNGKIQRSWLGISGSPLSKKVARALGLGKQYGCVVVKVEPNSPASAAGIEIGDILVALNEIAISEKTNLDFLLSSQPIGKVISLRVFRKKTTITLNVAVGARNDADLYRDIAEVTEKRDIPYRKIDGMDIGVSNLTPELRKSFDIPNPIKGVLVAYSGDSGLSVGDVIMTINQEDVVSIEDFQTKAKKLANDPLIIKNKEVAFYVYFSQNHRSDYTVIPYSAGYIPKVNKAPVPDPTGKRKSFWEKFGNEMKEIKNQWLRI
jgi:serine protease Do